MLLAIDVGNTLIKLGVFTGEGELSLLVRIVTDRSKTADQYAAEIQSVLRLRGAAETALRGAVLSSVVPPVTRSVAGAVETLLNTPPLVVGPGLRTGLDIRIDTPSQLGSDLVATAVGALHKYPRPVILIDMGTATKFSVLAPDAVFLGVSILPGLQMSLEALSARAAQLPHISLEKPGRVLGRNTVDSMRSGVVYGGAAMIDGMVARIEAEHGAAAAVVLTGGCAGETAGLCARRVVHDPNLLLEGLYWLHRKNP